CDRRWIRAGFGSGEVPVKGVISDEEMDAKYANPSEPSELLASAQLAEQANWLSSLSLLIDICAEDKIEGNDYESKSEEYKYRGDDLIEGNDKSESEEDDEYASDQHIETMHPTYR
ncbi:hypothetical protein TUN199_05139, partial [Pyrenophora tritici-repentis]